MAPMLKVIRLFPVPLKPRQSDRHRTQRREHFQTMSASKKRAVRPNLGGPLRPQAETPRHRFLYTDVTKAEHEKIQQYCKDKQISVSQFLADLMLQDARQSHTKRKQRKQKVNVQLEFDLTTEELDQLQ